MASAAGSLDLGVVFGAASVRHTFGGAAAVAWNRYRADQFQPVRHQSGYETPVTRVEYTSSREISIERRHSMRTDLAINYDYKLGGGASVFFHGEVINLFNQFQLCGCGGTVFNNGGGSDIRTINNGVLTAVNSALCRRSTRSRRLQCKA